MAANVYNRGQLITLELEIKKGITHVSSSQHFDPTSATILVYDPSSTLKTTAVLSKTTASSSGLYHHILVTSTNWIKGLYDAKIMCYDTLSYLDTEIFSKVFELT